MLADVLRGAPRGWKFNLSVRLAHSCCVAQRSRVLNSRLRGIPLEVTSASMKSAAGHVISDYGAA
jgi:hypothetical protein